MDELESAVNHQVVDNFIQEDESFLELQVGDPLIESVGDELGDFLTKFLSKLTGSQCVDNALLDDMGYNDDMLNREIRW